jgi:hypothetical protein
MQLQVDPLMYSCNPVANEQYLDPYMKIWAKPRHVYIRRSQIFSWCAMEFSIQCFLFTAPRTEVSSSPSVTIALPRTQLLPQLTRGDLPSNASSSHSRASSSQGAKLGGSRGSASSELLRCGLRGWSETGLRLAQNM